MKPAIAIALIVGGIVLIGIPPLADYLEKAEVFERVARGFQMEHSMPAIYRAGCFLVGAAMIAIAILSARRTQS